ncbi:Aminotran-1-2 domain-containing protein [Mycena venus]|uniref:Aminotran-1-2 domain-containing protein n=1 Tax=Mycena venus TaxID=2733690 RepID=A0A8H6XC93_9AGAR|nr:Aminotran-1-2 domain-containing protein [Mycena venus]
MTRGLRSIAETSLEAQLISALHSRDERSIRRRLPEPSTFSSSSGLIDFNSNDYLSLASSPTLRDRFLTKLRDAPDILGSGGSRLFFGSPAAILFNSGFDANVGFFSCVPQVGDVVVYDEYIHASVHDGVRASRARGAHYPFEHNSMLAFRALLTKLLDERPELKSGQSSLFVAVESLYSMDGTFAPLVDLVQVLDEFFPQRNGYLVVDEAHSTGIYGPQGRGRVAQLGLEDKVLARLHTFGKALAATGGTHPSFYPSKLANPPAAVILTSPLIRDYLLNYARSLIYTTSLSFANIIAADCSFDMLMDGTAQKLSNKVLGLSRYFVEELRLRLRAVPIHLLSPARRSAVLIRSRFAHHPNHDNPPTTAVCPSLESRHERTPDYVADSAQGQGPHRLIEGMMQWAEAEQIAEVHLAKDSTHAIQSKL